MLAVVALVGLGLLVPRLAPAPAAHELLLVALKSPQSADAPVAQIREELRQGCAPILQGSDTLEGRQVWAIILKPPHRKFPWIEVWQDQKTAAIIGWKRWGLRGKRPVVLQQSCLGSNRNGN